MELWILKVMVEKMVQLQVAAKEVPVWRFQELISMELLLQYNSNLQYAKMLNNSIVGDDIILPHSSSRPVICAKTHIAWYYGHLHSCGTDTIWD